MRQLLLVVCSCALALGSGSLSAPSAELAPGPVDLRVKTYNVNYGLAGDPQTTDAIGAGSPDLVLLQETTPAWERVLREAYGAVYPSIEFIDGPGAGGMGLLSRYPVETVEVLPSPMGWFPAWLVRVQTPRGPLQVLNLHLKPPYSQRGGFLVGAFSTGDDRLAELELYLAFVDPELPTIVLGDFNEGRGRALNLLARQGFSDALPAGVDTWRWSVAGFEIEAPLDHVFHGPQLRPVQVEVQDLGRSDHLPVMVGFTLE